MKGPFFILILTISTHVSIAQCENSDFEFGNFSGWTGLRGTCCPINLPTVGIFPGRHTIMTQGIDPHSCGNLNRVYQGNFSARLGNDGVGSRAEGLRYTFLVTEQSTLVQYAYAVVFQDPGHNDGEQPIFNSRVRRMDGTVVPCTEYSVSAGPNLPDYNYCPEIDILGDLVLVAYSDWRVISIDLSDQIGQMVTLEFEVGDCDLGGHYGYAYIDAISCGPVSSTVRYCQVNDMVLIEGPEGFATYEWNTGDTTRVITVENGIYDTLFCNVTTLTGCAVTLDVVLDPLNVLAEILCQDVCVGESVNFSNLTTSVSGYALLYDWNFGDLATSTEFEPTHTYQSSGVYLVSLTLELVGETCIDSTNCQVTVIAPPQISGQISHD